MTSDHLWRVITVAIAVLAVGTTAAAATTKPPAAAPLLPVGSRPPAAVAQGDDMEAPRHTLPTPETSAMAPSSSSGAETVDDSTVPETGSAPPRLRVPKELRIPDLGVESPVMPTWMDGNGSILVPDDVLITGWYDGSRRLNARQGTTVLVGHRDSASQGSGALYAIEELDIGSRITVIGRDGTSHAFTVQSTELIDKANLPTQAPRIFTRDGPYRLVLITCGGAFDASAGSYLSNVVVTAVPVSHPR